MLEKIRHSKLLFWTLELLLIAILIFVLQKINFIFIPIVAFFTTLFTPVLISGFLFYILNPIVRFMEARLRIRRIFGILIVFVSLILLIVLAMVNFIPILITQIYYLAENVPSIIKDSQEWLLSLRHYKIFENVDIESYVKNMDLQWAAILEKTLHSVANSLGGIFNVVAQTVMLVCTVPFALFYMLKDGHKIPLFLPKLFKKESGQKVSELLFEMNKTIATYISGQAIECLFVFVMMLIAYIFLGLNQYAFLFALIAGLCNLIPYIGPYFGLAPAFLTTIFTEPFKAFIIIIVVIIVQQIDGNLIYPNVIGKTLKIHPLTIIFVLMVAGNLAGFIGIFLAIPLYAITKTILKFGINIYKEHKAEMNAS